MGHRDEHDVYRKSTGRPQKKAITRCVPKALQLQCGEPSVNLAKLKEAPQLKKNKNIEPWNWAEDVRVLA